MIEKIVEFSGSLRKNGISVSIRSIKVACDASSILNKENLQEGLAKIYLKDRSYRKRFNKVYEEFFIKKENNEKDRKGFSKTG